VPGPASEVLAHWRKLGQFRRGHPAVGAGEHHLLQADPYIFSRTLDANGRTDRVLVAMGLRRGYKSIPVFGVFPSGTELVDTYSGEAGTVRNDSVTFTTGYGMLLLGEEPVGAEDSVVVYVTNNYEISLDILAVGNGTIYRMGTVSPGIPSRFVIRRDLLASDRQIEFVIRAPGIGPQVRTGRLQLRAGDTIVDVEIPPLVMGTRATVRP